MLLIKILFFTGLFLVFYSYIGYAILVWLLIRLRNLFRPPYTLPATTEWPRVSIVVAAYNEERFIIPKIENTLSLDYPPDKLDIIFITDGSTDNTPVLARNYPGIRVLHEPKRRGKVAAIHRAMQTVTTPVTIFCDANTLLNKESVYNILRHYADPAVGGVAGEKKVLTVANGQASGAGEGIYWKYESLLKRLDAELYTVVGAAGELFSIRTELYEPVPHDVLLDDFIISLGICRKGYRIAYEPDSFASETPSTSMKEEQKRKIRISAGAFQSMIMLKDLLNVVRYPVLSFQYISHRVLRWTVCPIALPPIFILNAILAANPGSPFYRFLLAAQCLFYVAAIAGWLLSNKNIKVKALYIPYYFFFLNLSLYLGFLRFKKGRQSVLWEKAARQ